MKYSFKIVNKKNEVELWDKLVTHSKSQLYLHHLHISACSQKIDRYFVYKTIN